MLLFLTLDVIGCCVVCILFCSCFAGHLNSTDITEIKYIFQQVKLCSPYSFLINMKL